MYTGENAHCPIIRPREVFIERMKITLATNFSLFCNSLPKDLDEGSGLGWCWNSFFDNDDNDKYDRKAVVLVVVDLAAMRKCVVSLLCTHVEECEVDDPRGGWMFHFVGHVSLTQSLAKYPPTYGTNPTHTHTSGPGYFHFHSQELARNSPVKCLIFLTLFIHMS